MKILFSLVSYASLILVLLSCGGSKDTGDSYEGQSFVEREKMLVSDNVKDRDRMTQMFIIIDEQADILKSFDDRRDEYTEHFLKQMGDYNSSAEELTNTLVSFQDEFKELLLLMTLENAELKAVATSKEWKDISNLKKETLF